MIFKKDDGVTEVVGFAFVLTIAILAVTMWMLIGMPIYATNDEIQHTSKVEFEMADLKTDIDTICLSNAIGVKREKVINLAPTSDKSKITTWPDFKTPRSFGSITITKGDEINEYGQYNKLKIIYSSSYMYSKDIIITYDGGELSRDVNGIEYTILDSVCNVVVPYNFQNISIGGNEAVVIDYTITDISGGNYVMSMEMK